MSEQEYYEKTDQALTAFVDSLLKIGEWRDWVAQDALKTWCCADFDGIKVYAPDDDGIGDPINQITWDEVSSSICGDIFGEIRVGASEGLDSPRAQKAIVQAKEAIGRMEQLVADMRCAMDNAIEEG